MLAEAAFEARAADVILSTHVHLSPVARLLRGPATRVYQFLHGVECWLPISMRSRWGLACADVLLCNSAFTHRRFLHHNPGFASLPSRVCWLGAPEDHLPEEASEESCGDELSVLIVGRIVGEERYKGHEQLIAVWPEVRRRFPRARLDIVGGGNASAALQDLAERRGLLASGAVRLWGQVSNEELRERYRRCSVFAMPSRGEGFGLVYLEAMAFGKPCLASLDDAASEVVLGEETGLLVRYADREGLLYALCRLLESRALRRKLGRAGRERVIAHFTERRFGERLWEALDL
jgi:glycosyltransferase involved in cell wall biosynthesis